MVIIICYFYTCKHIGVANYTLISWLIGLSVNDRVFHNRKVGSCSLYAMDLCLEFLSVEKTCSCIIFII